MKKQKLSAGNGHRIYENKLKCGAQRNHYSMFDVERSTCPQCLETGARQI